jgi:hypothetical protein
VCVCAVSERSAGECREGVQGGRTSSVSDESFKIPAAAIFESFYLRDSVGSNALNRRFYGEIIAVSGSSN